MNTGLQGLRSAKQVVQWMHMGIVPSQANAKAAREYLVDVDAPKARTVLGAIGMGLAPRQELCLEAISEIDVAIDQAREVSGAQLRERSERGG